MGDHLSQGMNRQTTETLLCQMPRPQVGPPMSRPRDDFEKKSQQSPQPEAARGEPKDSTWSLNMPQGPLPDSSTIRTLQAVHPSTRVPLQGRQGDGEKKSKGDHLILE